MNKELTEAIELIVKEKNVSKEAVIQALENALITAYKKEYGKNGETIYSSESVIAEFDEESGEYSIYAEKTVVENVTDSLYEISLEEAKQFDENCNIGDTVKLIPDNKTFGRIAAQGARSVFLQEIREEERNTVYRDLVKYKNHIIEGVVNKFHPNSISVMLGKVDGILTKSEQVSKERFHGKELAKFYVMDVKQKGKQTQVFLSRKHDGLIRELFAEEVEEVRNGEVTIKRVAREPGVRSKVAVYTENPKLDAIGACIGVAGIRINNITNELKNEKIDVVQWSENPAEFIENALSPAKVISVLADTEDKSATVIVPDSQLSLAIGIGGLNVRLVAKLTNYKIDILNETQGASIVEEYFQEFGE